MAALREHLVGVIALDGLDSELTAAAPASEGDTTLAGLFVLLRGHSRPTAPASTNRLHLAAPPTCQAATCVPARLDGLAAELKLVLAQARRKIARAGRIAV